MSFERNGVVIMEGYDLNDENHPANKAVSQVKLGDVRFPYGFFIRETNGKKYVEPATFQDKLDVYRTAFPGFDPNQIPMNSCIKDFEDRNRQGGCRPLPIEWRCMKVTQPRSGYFGCFCVNMA